jgi:acetyl-CoA carboxylase biotin carboxyl carrier protein
MNEQAIRQLIKIVEESNIDSLEVRRWFQTIRIIKNRGTQNGHHPSASGTTTLVTVPAPIVPPPAAPPVAAAPAPAPAPAAPEPVAPPSHLVEIKSPMVGTFYRAPAPDAPPFVELGKVIKVGDVLCIIEAMKLMNEIEAEQSGKIVKILVENAQPVEFGQPLFLIDPTAV